MKVLKHKKIKNTWLLFDVLTRKMVNESYQNNSAINTKQSFKIVENHFKEGTALNKELSLYRYLLEGEINKDIDINTMIDLVLESYKKSINFEQLNKEKYELFGDMKQMFENENSDVNIALQSNVSNYKTIASIYSLFEYVASDNTLYNIEQFMDSKKVVYTHINNKLNETVNEDLTKFKQLDESNKVLVFNILIEKFNKRYSNLTESQKRILKNYVNSVYDSAEFNNFMLKEFNIVRERISEFNNLQSDHKLKLEEISNQVNDILDKKLIKEHYVLSLLHIHKLFNDITTLYEMEKSNG